MKDRPASQRQEALISATSPAFTHKERGTNVNCDVRRRGRGLRHPTAWFDETRQLNSREERKSSDPRCPVKDGAVESAHFQTPASICSPSAVLSSFKSCTLRTSEWKNTVGRPKMQLLDKFKEFGLFFVVVVDLVTFLTLN